VPAPRIARSQGCVAPWSHVSPHRPLSRPYRRDCQQKRGFGRAGSFQHRLGDGQRGNEQVERAQAPREVSWSGSRAIRSAAVEPLLQGKISGAGGGAMVSVTPSINRPASIRPQGMIASRFGGSNHIGGHSGALAAFDGAPE
jgi:hypothetical protein